MVPDTATLAAIISSLGGNVLSEIVARQVTEEKVKQLAWDDEAKVNARIGELKERYAEFARKSNFALGQLVQWKPGLKNKAKPDYNEPAIVTDLIEQPIYDESYDSGSSYFRERLDIVLSFLNSEGDFVSFHFDSRRFEPLENQEKSS